MRVLVTGHRTWGNEDQGQRRILRRAMRQIDTEHPGEKITVIEGDCRYGGADRWARLYANYLGWKVESYPADWINLPRWEAGPKRNQQMVDTGADICIAFPLPGSKGTVDCIKRARAAGIPTRIYDEKGNYTESCTLL